MLDGIHIKGSRLGEWSNEELTTAVVAAWDSLKPFI